MPDILEIIRSRQSLRAPFDPGRPVPAEDLRSILEAARWAPTAHNMQNFEIVAVDDKVVLAALGALRSTPSEAFLRENYAQLSFSEEELRRKATGLLASQFPEAWRRPDASPEDAAAHWHGTLGAAMQDCPMLLVVLHDPNLRAPASEGDVLGFMSLGCVMQNMWLAAAARGLGMQILSAFGAAEVADAVHRLLAIPRDRKIAFACRLGYPAAGAGYLRVRREIARFAHRNRYGSRDPG